MRRQYLRLVAAAALLLTAMSGGGAEAQKPGGVLRINGPAREATFAMKSPDGGLREVTRRFDLLHVCPPQTAPDFVRRARSPAMRVVAGNLDRFVRGRSKTSCFGTDGLPAPACEITSSAMRSASRPTRAGSKFTVPWNRFGLCAPISPGTPVGPLVVASVFVNTQDTDLES
jgi:hypothetical protein